MNTRELQELVSDGESERLEFKRSTGQRTEAAKAVCAMLNGLGGFVLFGITDKGELVGQGVVAKTIEDITMELRKIEPPAFPDIETMALKKGSSVIVLTVPGGGGPYSFDGRPYLRHGPTNIVMPRAEYERRLIERLHATRRWENEPVADGVSFKDLNEGEIRTTLENAIRLGRLESPSRRDVKSILQGLELIHDGKLLNAAVALYGKTDRLKVLYPQLSLRVARFRGENRLSDFSDNREYWGDGFSLLKRAESFFMDHVPIAGRVMDGKIVREDRPLYPPRGTREALANALCHRDYSIPGGAVSVAMYDDHLEIANPGAFHFGMTPEKLVQPHESRPWNPIIAGVFYRAGIIEKWGMGTLNILDWCSENGNPAPSWIEQAGSVVLTFSPRVTPQEEIQRAHVETKVEPSRDQVGTKLALSRHQVEILLTCRKETGLVELMAITGRSDRTKFRHQVLSPLLRESLIEMTIPDKPRSSKQRYRLTAQGKDTISRVKPKGAING